MLVRAIAPGYFEGYREIGAEFPIPEDQPAAPWWVPADQPAVVVEEPAQPETFSEMNAAEPAAVTPATKKR